MNEHYPFVNPPLPYAYDALEPYIDTLTMHLHRDRHLQTYVDNLNRTLKDYPVLHEWPLEELLTNADRLPADIHTPVRNNAGGVYNHIFYFSGMSPSDTRHYAGALYDAVVRDFGSTDAFFQKFKDAALSVFGSGYAWLTADGNSKLSIITTANQDTPLTGGCAPSPLSMSGSTRITSSTTTTAQPTSTIGWVADWRRASEFYKLCVGELG